MTTKVKRSQRQYTPEQEARLREMAVAFSKQMEPMYEAYTQVTKAFEEPQKIINTALAEVSRSFELPKGILEAAAIDTKLVEVSSIVNTEDLQRVARSLAPTIERIELMKADLKVDTSFLQALEFKVPDGLLESVSAITSSIKTPVIEPSVLGCSEVRRRPQYTDYEPQYERSLTRIDERFDRLEMRVEVLSAHIISTKPAVLEETSDFKFHIEGLYLTHNGARLTRLSAYEMVLCQKLFSKPVGHNFPTSELEDLFYPEPHSPRSCKQENFKKAVDRFNQKIANFTGVEKLIAYSKVYTTRII